MSKVKTRPYRSQVRADQAARTRRRIVEAARRLFIADGYANTSIASVARAAAVAPETIYDGFGTKRRVLEAVVEAAIAGRPNEPQDFLDREWVAELISEPDVRTRLDRFVLHTVETLERMAPIHALLRTAAAGDAALADLPAEMHARRFGAQARILSELTAVVQLSPRAADTFSALTSPELHQLLRRVRGWTRETYAEWLRETLLRAVLRD